MGSGGPTRSSRQSDQALCAADLAARYRQGGKISRFAGASAEGETRHPSRFAAAVLVQFDKSGARVRSKPQGPPVRAAPAGRPRQLAGAGPQASKCALAIAPPVPAIGGAAGVQNEVPLPFVHRRAPSNPRAPTRRGNAPAQPSLPPLVPHRAKPAVRPAHAGAPGPGGGEARTQAQNGRPWVLSRKRHQLFERVLDGGRFVRGLRQKVPQCRHQRYRPVKIRIATLLVGANTN